MRIQEPNTKGTGTGDLNKQTKKNRTQEPRTECGDQKTRTQEPKTEREQPRTEHRDQGQNTEINNPWNVKMFLKTFSPVRL